MGIAAEAISAVNKAIEGQTAAHDVTQGLASPAPAPRPWLTSQGQLLNILPDVALALIDVVSMCMYFWNQVKGHQPKR